MDRQGKNKAQKEALCFRFVLVIATGIVRRVNGQDGPLAIKTTGGFFDNHLLTGIAANFLPHAVRRQ
jgi:hypothetical protein